MNKENLSIIEKWQRKSINDYDYGTIETLKRYLHNAWETQELLEYRIQKAIEYIENCNYGTEEYKIYEIATTGVEELLDILKGE
jgi:hypothetical protein